ncbi:VhaAC45-related protein [Carabus blaptoides fortunei]
MLYLLHLFLLINAVFGGVLILSPKKVDISSLKPFDEETYQMLRDSFKKTKLISFKINSERIPNDCEHVALTKYTSYVPNVEYLPDNIIVLNKSTERNCDDIKKKIRTLDLDNQKNVIYLIMHDGIRIKRSIELTTDLSNTTVTDEPLIRLDSDKTLPKDRQTISPDAPVLYSMNGNTMLYSSKALVLKLANESVFLLGSAIMCTTDKRDMFLRLICNVALEQKVTLRFRFPMEGSYWYLTSVEVRFPDKEYNLTIGNEITAPRAFSYRCGGKTVFTDGSVLLTVYDMQVQPETKDGRFSDAYNCVPFMTAPIWSGIFVTSILAVALIIGLGALGSIKTMDKFDNSKTKQLTITVMGE